jgi:hypothetical protein
LYLKLDRLNEGFSIEIKADISYLGRLQAFQSQKTQQHIKGDGIIAIAIAIAVGFRNTVTTLGRPLQLCEIQ